MPLHGIGIYRHQSRTWRRRRPAGRIVDHGERWCPACSLLGPAIAVPAAYPARIWTTRASSPSHLVGAALMSATGPCLRPCHAMPRPKIWGTSWHVPSSQCETTTLLT
jgi:hypothetical protein